MNCMRFASVLLMLLVWAGTALALGGGYPKGEEVGSRPDNWPKGLKEALEVQGHEGGYFVNANDFYWYRGDAKALNRFLVESAKIEGAPVFIRFHAGEGRAKPPWPDAVAVPMDWQVSIFCRGWSRELPEDAATEYMVRIDVWEGGQVKRDAVVVPARIIAQPGEPPATGPAR